jgi:hypothetical protein
MEMYFIANNAKYTKKIGLLIIAVTAMYVLKVSIIIVYFSVNALGQAIFAASGHQSEWFLEYSLDLVL